MQTNQPRLIVKRREQIVMVTLADADIIDEIQIQQIGVEVTALIAKLPTPKILIDFHRVQRLSSSALSLFIRANQSITGKGGIMRITGIQPMILKIFRITSLDKVLNIDKNIEQAVANF